MHFQRQYECVLFLETHVHDLKVTVTCLLLMMDKLKTISPWKVLVKCDGY